MKTSHKVWLALVALVAVCVAIPRQNDQPVPYDELMAKIGVVPKLSAPAPAIEQPAPLAPMPVPTPAPPALHAHDRRVVADQLAEIAFEALTWEITVLHPDSVEACAINIKNARSQATGLSPQLASQDLSVARARLATCVGCTAKSWAACWDVLTLSRLLGASAPEFEYDPSAALPKKTGRARATERSAITRALQKLVVDAHRRCKLHPGDVDDALDELADTIRRRAQALEPLDENLLASAEAVAGCTECGLQMAEYCRRAAWASERAKDEPGGRVVGRE